MKRLKEILALLGCLFLMVVFLGSSDRCGYTPPQSDSTIPEGAYNIKYHFVTYFAGPAESITNEDYKQALLNSDFSIRLGHVKSSMGAVLRMSSQGWPSNDGASILKDNINLEADPSLLSVDLLLAKLNAVDSSIPANANGLVWTSEFNSLFFDAVSGNWDKLCDDHDWGKDKYLDNPRPGEPNRLKFRPVYIIYGSGPTGDGPVHYGTTRSDIRITVINSAQVQQAVEHGWVNSYFPPLVPGWAGGSPWTNERRNKWLGVFVKMHEVAHHLVPDHSHHSTSNDNLCALDRFRNNAKLSTDKICHSDWGTTGQYLKWVLSPIPPPPTI